MTGLNDAPEFLVELISQLFHVDALITEQAERIEALEHQIGRLRAVLAKTTIGGGGVSRRHVTAGEPLDSGQMCAPALTTAGAGGTVRNTHGPGSNATVVERNGRRVKGRCDAIHHGAQLEADRHPGRA